MNTKYIKYKEEAVHIVTQSVHFQQHSRACKCKYQSPFKIHYTLAVFVLVKDGINPNLVPIQKTNNNNNDSKSDYASAWCAIHYI